ARRLVEGDEGIVLMDYGQPVVRGRDVLVAGGHAHGWDADAVPGRDTPRRLDALAVDAHFATAQDAVDVAFRHALQARQQEVVDALAGFLVRHLDPAHRRRRGCVFATARHAAYTYVVDFQEIDAGPRKNLRAD